MANKIKLGRNVILTGMTSFFTDISSEMVYPLIQAFVSMILAANRAMIGPVLGIIEGIAESTASFVKVLSGYYSDRYESRKLPTIGGYGLSAVAKIFLFIASFGWVFVLIARFFDRVGKGIRTAPRDALISDSTPPEIQGKAFGFHRAMDYAGAFIGVLVCYFVSLRFFDHATGTIRDISSFYILFVISIIPAVIGVFFLLFLKEERKTAGKSSAEKPRPNLDFRRYDRSLKFFFLAQLFFTLGNSSNQFLLLRSMNLGLTLPVVILLYMLFNLSTMLLSTAFGSLSDRIGRKKVIIGGYFLYALVYASFGFITQPVNYLLWVFWPLYGVYYAMTEGVEKALVSEIAPRDSKATALGLSNTIAGIGLLPASVIAGVLFTVSPGLPFLFGGAMALAAVAAVVFGVKSGG